MRSPAFGILTVLHLNRWLTHSGDFHFQFVPLSLVIFDMIH